MPNTDVFLAMMISSLGLSINCSISDYAELLLFGSNLEFVGNFRRPGNGSGFACDVLFLFRAAHRATKDDGAIADDDLDVVRVRGQRLVVIDGLTNLAGQFTVRRIHLLLV